MKTVQVSVEFWQRLKVEAAVRGVTVRSVLEEVGAEWMSRHPRDVMGLSIELVANRGAIEALKAHKPTLIAPPGTPGFEIRDEAAREFVRELKVELEE